MPSYQWVWALSIVSGISIMFVGAFLLLNRNFGKHPYPLLAWTCIIQSFYYFSKYVIITDCFFDKYTALSKTLGLFSALYEHGFVQGIELILGSSYTWIRNYPEEYITSVRWAFFAFWHFQYDSNIMDVAMNTLIFLDLYWTIQDPFQPTRFRTRYYLVGLLLLLCIQMIIMNYFWTFQSVFVLDRGSLMLAGVLFTLILASIYSSVLLYIRLNKKGTSRELKRKVLKRNYVYFSIFMLSALCAVVTQSGSNFNADAILYPQIDDHIEKKWVIASYSLGVPLAMTRLSEPFVW